MEKISEFLCKNTNNTFLAYPFIENVGTDKVNSTIYDLECDVIDDLNGNLILHN